MKYSLAVLALLGLVSAENKSLTERAKEEDEIMAGTSEQWSNLGHFKSNGDLLDSTNIDLKDENTSISTLNKAK